MDYFGHDGLMGLPQKDLYYTYKDEGYVFTIEEVREFQNLKSTCSENSYYKCLANRFRKFDYDNALGFTDMDGGKCRLRTGP